MPRSRIIIVSKFRTRALFDGLPYAQIIVNEQYVGESERSGCLISYTELVAFIEKVDGVTQEQKEKAKAELRLHFYPA